jgi:hypothetical protein
MLRLPIFLTTALLGGFSSATFAADPAFTIDQPIVVLKGEKDFYFSQARAAVIPSPTWKALITTQETETRGTHGYRDLFMLESPDGIQWSHPERVSSLARISGPEGRERVIGDTYPKWHAKTGTVLLTGKTFNFKDGKEDRSLEQIAYAVFEPATGKWSNLETLSLPERDARGALIVAPNSGCVQRVDREDGKVLLPFRYRRNSPEAPYVTSVALCDFDGQKLTYLSHGSELSKARLYEPSLTQCNGRFFLTMRSDNTGYVCRSEDGLNYSAPVEWTFDDGTPLGSYNTQQHWLSNGQALYLVYTRRGANNDHIFRNRAPLFVAEVDPEKLCVIRATEQIVIPENNAEMGNFGVTNMSPDESWVMTSEMLMSPVRSNDRRQVILAKIHWTAPNTNFPLN